MHSAETMLLAGDWAGLGSWLFFTLIVEDRDSNECQLAELIYGSLSLEERQLIEN